MVKFKIGQQVVVNDTILTPEYQRLIAITRGLGMRAPEHLKVYTIRGGREFPVFGFGYLLEEIVNPPRRFSFADITELHFDECLFSPVQTTSAEAEKLRRLSDPSLWTPEDHERFLAQPIERKQKEVVNG